VGSHFGTIEIRPGKRCSLIFNHGQLNEMQCAKELSFRHPISAGIIKGSPGKILAFVNARE
jgi:hypothetical protein